MEKILYKAREERIVVSCAYCPNVIGGFSGWPCMCKRDKSGDGRELDIHIYEKTLPEWCPLPTRK